MVIPIGVRVDWSERGRYIISLSPALFAAKVIDRKVQKSDRPAWCRNGTKRHKKKAKSSNLIFIFYMPNNHRKKICCFDYKALSG